MAERSGRGRPRDPESERRRKHFASLVASGMALDEAAATARINEKRALRLLSSPEMRQVIAHTLAA